MLSVIFHEILQLQTFTVLVFQDIKIDAVPQRRRRDVITSSDVRLRHLKRSRRQLNDFDLSLSFGVRSEQPGEL